MLPTCFPQLPTPLPYISMLANSINPFIATMPLKTNNKSAKSLTLKPFCFLFHTHMWKDFHKKCIALKADVLQDWKIYCLQAHPCIFQSGSFPGWGSEGVNDTKNLSDLDFSSSFHTKRETVAKNKLDFYWKHFAYVLNKRGWCCRNWKNPKP